MDRRQFIAGSAAFVAGLLLPESPRLALSSQLAGLAPSASGAPSLRAGMYGVSWEAHSVDAATRETCLTLLDDIGATWGRVGANWAVTDWAVSEAEALAGDFSDRDWSRLDMLVDAELAHNKKVIVAIIQFASWANGGQGGWWVPETGAFGYWQDFCAAVVSHCDTQWPGRIRHYEIWNEPEVERFWTNPATRLPNHAGADPAAYVKLLRAAYLGVKSVNPQAQVIGMVPSRAHAGFLRDCYEQIALQFPAEREAMNDFFDVFGCHPYCDDRAPDDNDPAFIWNSGTLNRNFLGLVDCYNELLDHGDGHKGVICTEFGWHTSPAYGGDPYVVTEAQQADYMVRALDMAREWPWLKVLMSFGFMNDPFNEAPWSPIRADFSRKPSYEATAYAIRRGT